MLRKLLIVPEIAADVVACVLAALMVPFAWASTSLHKKRTGRSGNPYDGF